MKPKTDISRMSGGRFAPGNAGGGRTKGSKNLKTVIGAELFAALHEGSPEHGLPSAWERWKRLLCDKSAAVRLRAEEVLADRVWGRTRQETGADAPTSFEIRFVNDWKGIDRPTVVEKH